MAKTQTKLSIISYNMYIIMLFYSYMLYYNLQFVISLNYKVSHWPGVFGRSVVHWKSGTTRMIACCHQSEYPYYKYTFWRFPVLNGWHNRGLCWSFRELVNNSNKVWYKVTNPLLRNIYAQVYITIKTKPHKSDFFSFSCLHPQPF